MTVLVVRLGLVAVVVVIQLVLLLRLDQLVVVELRAAVMRDVDARNVISTHWPFVLQHFLCVSTGERLRRCRSPSISSETHEKRQSSGVEECADYSPLLLITSRELGDAVAVPLHGVLARRWCLVELIADTHVRRTCISQRLLLLTIVVLGQATLFPEFSAAGARCVSRLLRLTATSER